MIVANDVKAQGAGFGTDTNIVTMYRKDGSYRVATFNEERGRS